MDDKDKEEIIKTVGELKGDIAVLNTKYDNLSAYMFNDLKDDIEELCEDVKQCMTRAETCYKNNFKWVVSTMIGFTLAISCVIGLIVTVVM
jgi:hypothetical protein